MNENKLVKEYARDREWAVPLSLIDSGSIDCIVCMEPAEMYNEGHQRVMRCKNGHQVFVSTHHSNN